MVTEGSIYRLLTRLAKTVHARLTTRAPLSVNANGPWIGPWMIFLVRSQSISGSVATFQPLGCAWRRSRTENALRVTSLPDGDSRTSNPAAETAQIAYRGGLNALAMLQFLR